MGRWDFEYIGINENAVEIKGTKVLLGADKHCVEWNELREKINGLLHKKCRINEDKLLGPFFLSKEIIEADEATGLVKDNDKFLKAFKSKVIMYIYEDAGKQFRSTIFCGCEEGSTYSSVCEEFDTKGERIFGDDLNLTPYDSTEEV